ncbi:hypothetical protein [Ferrimonas lipolytica]|uniref:YXWGXW repeat-containing protein n=1 Tax=Ferrimonas lipolytica TaxID=2724191 RepID=A0A6H1UIF5_9GAMM|nr:hypothetical protein [Ferrimonas lipolytica]QIZ77996.1 hypothetical protein HER31_14480 [Ferrimonas lipolytica]
MKRLSIFLLMVAVPTAIQASTALQSVGLSVGWDNYRSHHNSWHDDWRYRNRFPYYGYRRAWLGRHDYWRHNDYRYNTHDRYLRPTPQAHSTVVQVAPVSSITVRSEQVKPASLASLPANARLEKTANGIVYHWQQQCYQLDQDSFRYQQRPCPQ